VSEPDHHSIGTANLMLEAAIQTIADHGEVGIRVEAVARAAGVAKPTLYHFYGDREGLIEAAQCERYRRTLAYGVVDQFEMIRHCRSGEEFQALVRAWTGSLGDEAGEERRRIRIEVLGSSVSRPALRQRIAAIEYDAAGALAEVLAYARDRGWVRSDLDLHTAAVWWFGMMNGRYLVESPNSAFDPTAWDTLATETVMSVLFG
jgi:AcrR family transcriptional regulator